MTKKRVTAEQILASIGTDVEEMAKKIADSINNAKYGSIITDTEEPVRDATAEFRKQAYQKALNLLDERAFSPSQGNGSSKVEEQG